MDVVSTGSLTHMATPALMGGYEYTVDQINLRKDEKLVDRGVVLPDGLR